MKRRIFLTAASTVGIVGVASSATVVSSVYKSVSESVILQEFDTPSIKQCQFKLSRMKNQMVINALFIKIKLEK